jgi:hypothetical protein
MNDVDDSLVRALERRHLAVGWWGLLVFLSLGTVLEALHGFKVGLYLDVGNDARRLTWTLAHAHGTLLSLLNIAYALTLRRISDHPPVPAWSSGALVAATLLIPAGFLLGGVFVHGGDPGLGVVLVPIGAGLLFAAVWAVARAVRRPPKSQR